MIPELQHVLSSVDLPVDWVGLRAVKEASTLRAVRDGQPELNRKELSTGVMVEVLAQGQMGYSAVNSLQPERLRQAVKAAYEQAIAASRWAIYPLTAAVRPPVSGRYTTPVQTPFDALSPGAIYDVLVKLCHLLKVSDQVVQTSATAITTSLESWYVSSSGAEVYQQQMLLSTHCGAIAQAGPVVQQRTSNGHLARCYQGGWELFLEDSLWERARRTGEQAVELLSAEDCPTTTTTLVLAPDQMMLQIHESVGHPLELDRILGDERNYAGGSFVKPSDFGQLAYGSPLMNITFNPAVPGEFASYRFDDTGAPAEREYVIQAGILQRGLGSLESQLRLGVPGVACARASSWNRPPIDRMANLNLEAGTDTAAELIADIEDGVYMEANRSWSIDDQRYKFQFGCEYGRRIQQGRLTTPLRNPNYRGTTPSFWHSLVRVGNADTWELYGTPFCGKGEPNQAIRVGHGAPLCAFAEIEVFGGG